MTHLDRSALLSQYEADTRSRSSAPTSLSLWRTWQFFHCRWFGPHSGALPITVESLKCVVAQLKHCGYASCANYISAAKDEHLSQGHSWSEFLAREAKRAIRTAGRGVAAPRQDSELDLVRIHGLALPLGENEPLVPGGPVGARRMAIFASFHLLRELEISTMLASRPRS